MLEGGHAGSEFASNSDGGVKPSCKRQLLRRRSLRRHGVPNAKCGNHLLLLSMSISTPQMLVPFDNGPAAQATSRQSVALVCTQWGGRLTGNLTYATRAQIVKKTKKKIANEEHGTRTHSLGLSSEDDLGELGRALVFGQSILGIIRPTHALPLRQSPMKRTKCVRFQREF